MDVERRYTWGILGVGAIALAHAAWTWSPERAAALFVGGAAIAFIGEVVVVQLGLVEHTLEPRVVRVPVLVLLAWPATVYVALRLALLIVPLGVGAAALAAVLATAYDVVADPRGVEAGVWRYPRHPLSAGRYRGVPYWNFAGWFAISFLTALLATVVA